MRTEKNNSGWGAAACWGAADALPGSAFNVHTDPWSTDSLPTQAAKSARLLRTVEAEILPRLMLLRDRGLQRERVNESQTATRSLSDSDDVLELTRVLLLHDATVAWAFVETVLQRGASMQQVCLDILAPSARRLGVMWEQDECDFMQVTVGLCRLHQVLHQLNSKFRTPSEHDAHEHPRRALIASLPGEQHTFGVVMVSQFMRVAGWTVHNEFPQSNRELLDSVRDSWYAVAGISVGSELRLPIVADVIRTLRGASTNKALCVLVGGPIFVDHPERAAEVGADGTAADGRFAVQIADDLYGSLVAQK